MSATEQAKARMRQYQKDHLADYRSRNKKYRQANPKYDKKRKQSWYQRNKERLKQQYEANKFEIKCKRILGTRKAA